MNSIKNAFQVNSSGGGGGGEGIEQNRKKKKTSCDDFGEGEVEEGIGINGGGKIIK